MCVCPIASYAVREAAGVNKCLPCHYLSGHILGVQDKADEPINWENEKVCPGGESNRTKICPL